MDRGVIEGLNSEAIAGAIDSVAIDRVFSDSVNLDNSAILEFVRQLCAVAKSELAAPDGVRLFLLQKTVDVAYFNMGRIRLVWSRLWTILAEFLAEIGLFPEFSVAAIAVDSIRQLNMQALQKEELANYHFQRELLRPFEKIMGSSGDRDVRDMVVACLRQIVLTRTGNIKSGWRGIFAVLSLAAGEDSESTIQAAFDLVETIISGHFVQVASFFTDSINCLMDYGRQTCFPEVALKAIDFVHFWSRELAEGRVSEVAPGGAGEGASVSGAALETPPRSSSPGGGEMSPRSPVVLAGMDPEEVHMKFWWPLLMGLASLVAHPHLAVRTKALQVLFDVLKAYGEQFSEDLWGLLFRGVLFPMFDDVTHSDEPDNEWLKSTALNALRALVDLYVQYAATLVNLLPEVLDLLGAFILQRSEALARIGATCLSALVEEAGPGFDSDRWSLLVDKVVALLEGSMPQMLADTGAGLVLEAPSAKDLPVMDTSAVIAQCVVQLLMVGVATDMGQAMAEQDLETGLVLRVVEALKASAQFACEFNDNADARAALVEYTDLDTLPNLIKQETASTTGSLLILLALHGKDGGGVGTELFPLMSRVIDRFNAMQVGLDAGVASLAWTPVAVMVLRAVVGLEEGEFDEFVRGTVGGLTELILSERGEVREVLKEVFDRMWSERAQRA